MDRKAIKIIIKGIRSAGSAIKKMSDKKSIFSAEVKKKDFDWGVPADKVSEKIILDAINKSKLDCEIIAEESGIIRKKEASYKIYIDPLDGSVNFSRGLPEFCIGMGIFSIKDEPLVGIIYDINRNELFIAEQGKGITLNGKKINRIQFENARLINLEWFGAKDYVEIVQKLRSLGLRARNPGSGVLALLYGAIGRGDGSILVDNSPWDIAPGMVFAQETGVIIKQLNGDEVDLNQDKISIFAAPPNLFNKIYNNFKI